MTRPGRPSRGSPVYTEMRITRALKAIDDLALSYRLGILRSYCPNCALRLSPAFPHVCAPRTK